MDDLQVDRIVRRNVFDDNFWTQLRTSMEILEPITVAITKVEADIA
jgi:hypothetical protein